MEYVSKKLKFNRKSNLQVLHAWNIEFSFNDKMTKAYSNKILCASWNQSTPMISNLLTSKQGKLPTLTIILAITNFIVEITHDVHRQNCTNIRSHFIVPLFLSIYSGAIIITGNLSYLWIRNVEKELSSAINPNRGGLFWQLKGRGGMESTHFRITLF